MGTSLGDLFLFVIFVIGLIRDIRRNVTYASAISTTNLAHRLVRYLISFVDTGMSMGHKVHQTLRGRFKNILHGSVDELQPFTPRRAAAIIDTLGNSSFGETVRQRLIQLAANVMIYALRVILRLIPPRANSDFQIPLLPEGAKGRRLRSPLMIRHPFRSELTGRRGTSTECNRRRAWKRFPEPDDFPGKNVLHPGHKYDEDCSLDQLVEEHLRNELLVEIPTENPCPLNCDLRQERVPPSLPERTISPSRRAFVIEEDTDPSKTQAAYTLLNQSEMPLQDPVFEEKMEASTYGSVTGFSQPDQREEPSQEQHLQASTSGESEQGPPRDERFQGGQHRHKVHTPSQEEVLACNSNRKRSFSESEDTDYFSDDEDSSSDPGKKTSKNRKLH